MKYITLFFSLFTFFFGNAQKLHKIGTLTENVNESSGLIFYNDTLFISHNDSGDKPILYFLNLKGAKIHQVQLENASNVDWEEITKDEQGNIYVGDIGNNNNTRKDLVIYKIASQDLLKVNSVIATKIYFKYPEQTTFPPAENELRYDAEAMVAFNDSLYIFTKCRTIPFEGISYCYVVPSVPGNYEAKRKFELFIGKGGFMKDAVTGATYCKSKLYINTYNRFLIYSFDGNRVTFEKQVSTLPYSQKEAILTKDNKTIYLTDEEQKFMGGRYLYKIELKQ
jgi:hypothetical protein